MTYLLDSTTGIRYLNGRSLSVRARLEQLSPADLCICSGGKAELWYGALPDSGA